MAVVGPDLSRVMATPRVKQNLINDAQLMPVVRQANARRGVDGGYGRSRGGFFDGRFGRVLRDLIRNCITAAEALAVVGPDLSRVMATPRVKQNLINDAQLMPVVRQANARRGVDGGYGRRSRGFLRRAVRAGSERPDSELYNRR